MALKESNSMVLINRPPFPNCRYHSECRKARDALVAFFQIGTYGTQVKVVKAPQRAQTPDAAVLLA